MKIAYSKHIENFSESCSIDELVQRLILVEKIDNGLKQSAENEVLSEKDLDQEVKTWFY